MYWYAAGSGCTAPKLARAPNATAATSTPEISPVWIFGYKGDQAGETGNAFSQPEVAPPKNLPIDHGRKNGDHGGNEAGESTQRKPSQDRLITGSCLDGSYIC